MPRPIPQDMDPPFSQNDEVAEEGSHGDNSSLSSKSGIAADDDSAARCPKRFQLVWETGKIRTRFTPKQVSLLGFVTSARINQDLATITQR